MTARQLVAVSISALALAAVAAPSAVAAPLGVLGVNGSTGTGDGQFQGTGGVAVNESTGNVYVIDIGGNRIERFGADGQFQSAFGSAGSGDGELALETVGDGQLSPQLAIDQADGSVYVTDTGNDRVQKFSAAGAYQSQFGMSGSGFGQFADPVGVAVDPTDRSVYVVDNGNDRVQKFSSAGAYLLQFGSEGRAATMPRTWIRRERSAEQQGLVRLVSIPLAASMCWILDIPTTACSASPPPA